MVNTPPRPTQNATDGKEQQQPSLSKVLLLLRKLLQLLHSEGPLLAFCVEVWSECRSDPLGFDSKRLMFQCCTGQVYIVCCRSYNLQIRLAVWRPASWRGGWPDCWRLVASWTLARELIRTHYLYPFFHWVTFIAKLFC